MKILKFLALTLAALLVVTFILFSEGDIPADVVDARYSSPASQFLDLGDQGRIHYRDEGNRRSMPVVLIHGSNASLHTFEPWVRLLEDSYRVITIDMPAHGLTGSIPSGDYSTGSMLNAISAVTDHLDLERFVIGGNSMGGRLALTFASREPEHIIGLVVLNSSAPWAKEEFNAESSSVWGFTLLQQPWFRTIATRLDPYYLVSQGLMAAYNQSPVVDEALIMRYNDMILREGTRDAIAASWSGSRDAREDIDPESLTFPVLLMWGRNDTVVPFAKAWDFESRLPDVTTAYYDDVGHIPMEEKPEQTAADLRRFLEQLTADDGEGASI